MCDNVITQPNHKIKHKIKTYKTTLLITSPFFLFPEIAGTNDNKYFIQILVTGPKIVLKGKCSVDCGGQ